MKIAAVLLGVAQAAKVKLIIDSDAGFDVDDIGALAIANHLADLNRVELLATMSSVCCDKSIAGLNVINTYYGRQDSVVLGAYKGDFGCDCDSSQNSYLTDLVDNFPNNGVLSSADVQDAL